MDLGVGLSTVVGVLYYHVLGTSEFSLKLIYLFKQNIIKNLFFTIVRFCLQSLSKKYLQYSRGKFSLVQQ